MPNELNSKINESIGKNQNKTKKSVTWKMNQMLKESFGGKWLVSKESFENKQIMSRESFKVKSHGEEPIQCK